MAEPQNPWISPDQDGSTEEDTRAHEETSESPSETGITGPAGPHPGLSVSPATGLPSRNNEQTARLWWVGAHGGAGETTLSRLLPGSAAAEHVWPHPATADLAPAYCILVARTNVAGLYAAQEALQQWASGELQGIELLGLVLNTDAPGKEPKALRELEKLVSGGAPRTWHLPWVEEWRTDPPSPDFSAHPVNRSVRRVIRAAEHLLPT